MFCFRAFRNRKWLKYLSIFLFASTDACLAILLVYPNAFAPSSILGVATMIQYLLGVQTGYQFLLINAPLLIIAFFKLSRSYAIKSAVYVISFSVASIFIQNLISIFGLHRFGYVAESPDALFLVAIVYGVAEGIVYSTIVSLGGSTAGTDIVAALVNRYLPRFNTVWILFTLKVCIAGMSYFVYGRQILPVIVSIVCGFAGSVVSDTILKGRETALKFEVVTEHAEELSEDLMNRLGHGCTCIPSRGMYESRENALLICVVNKRQRYDFETIIAKYPNTFAYCHSVKCTYGYFDK